MPVHGSEGRWPPPKPYRGRGTDVEKVEGRAVNGHLDAFVDLPAPAAPANPAMMNRRPRRARPPPGVLLFTPCTVDARGGYSGSGSSVDCGSPPLRVCDLPLLPPPTRGQQKAQWDDQGISPRRARAALDGVEYGPRNTCAVDTFLTLLTHALTADEKRELRRVSSPAVRVLFQALRALRERQSRRAKRLWYAQLSSEPASTSSSPCDATAASEPAAGAKRRWANGRPGPSARHIKCDCRCACDLCEGGHCLQCARCACKRPWLIGHCFGVMEQFFSHLLPPSTPSSPFHMRALSEWRSEQSSARAHAAPASRSHTLGQSWLPSPRHPTPRPAFAL